MQRSQLNKLAFLRLKFVKLSFKDQCYIALVYSF